MATIQQHFYIGNHRFCISAWTDIKQKIQQYCRNSIITNSTKPCRFHHNPVLGCFAHFFQLVNGTLKQMPILLWICSLESEGSLVKCILMYHSYACLHKSNLCNKYIVHENKIPSIYGEKHFEQWVSKEGFFPDIIKELQTIIPNWLCFSTCQF